VAHLGLQERDGPVALGDDLDLFGVRGALGQAEEGSLLFLAVYVADLHPGCGRRPCHWIRDQCVLRETNLNNRFDQAFTLNPACGVWTSSTSVTKGLPSQLTLEGTRHQLVGKILETVRQDTRHSIQSLHSCSRKSRTQPLRRGANDTCNGRPKTRSTDLSRLVHGIKHATCRMVRKIRRALTSTNTQDPSRRGKTGPCNHLRWKRHAGQASTRHAQDRRRAPAPNFKRHVPRSRGSPSRACWSK